MKIVLATPSTFMISQSRFVMQHRSVVAMKIKLMQLRKSQKILTFWNVPSNANGN